MMSPNFPVLDDAFALAVKKPGSNLTILSGGVPEFRFRSGCGKSRKYSNIPFP